MMRLPVLQKWCKWVRERIADQWCTSCTVDAKAHGVSSQPSQAVLKHKPPQPSINCIKPLGLAVQALGPRYKVR